MPKARRKTSAKPRPIRRKPSLDFSVTGLVYCTMMMFIGLAAINTQANLLFGVFGLMIGILFISFLISGMVIVRLKVERVLPDHAMVGRPTAISYQITNRKRFWPSLSVTVSEYDGLEAFHRQPSAYMLHCANRSTAIIPAEVIPRQRGVFEFDHFQLSTSFPFGFIKRAINRGQKDSLVILPAIGTMRRELMQRFRSAESEGHNVRPSRGGMDEFYGLREYRPGENPRRIYWKRSARTGTLALCEMTRVSPPKLIVVVDTCASDQSREMHIAVERAIAIAATVIDNVIDAGLLVGLVAWSGQYIAVQPNIGKRHRLELLSHLARLERSPAIGANDLLEYARPMFRSDTTAVLVSPADVSVGLGDAARGSLVALSSREDLYRRYFGFPDEIDFAAAYVQREPLR
ncbi:MAG: DUF58 domain-containing protein [Burkholderiales bacterium]|nr:DUF58 domain-containing protein [Phycisphaerae bacterium]